jgi:transposase
MRPHGQAAELERRRRRAVRLLDQGLAVCHVARLVGVAPVSVSRWRDARDRGGGEALASKPVPGRPAKLSQGQRVKLIRLLKQGPLAHGYPNELWTLKRVADLIEKHFAVHYDPSSVWHILNAMQWSCQKPERRARERDEQAIARWRRKDWPRLKKIAKKR